MDDEKTVPMKTGGAADGETARAEQETAPPLQQREPVTFLGLTMPPGITNTVYRVQDFGTHLRRTALRKAPASAVNHSSNIIAGMHLFAETLMFKANGNNLMHEDRKGKLIHYVIDPPRNIWRSFIGDAKLPHAADLKSSFTLSKWTHAFAELRDVDGATKKALAALKPGEVLHNHWQGRATLTGVIGWGIPFASPDYKDKEEDVERNITRATQNPLLFGASRIKDAVFYPFDTAIKLVKKAIDPKTDQELGKNKLQFTGLGVTIYGIWSTLGAWRNTGKHPIGHPLAGQRYYYFNRMYLVTGLISIFAGIPPLFATNNEKGWVGFGTHMQLRSLFLPQSIYTKFKKHDAGVGYYSVAHLIFQTHNAIASLIGGAHKLPDGTVEDHSEERKVVRHQAIEEKHEQALHKNDNIDTPDYRISQANSPQRLAAPTPEKEAVYG